MSFMHYYDKIKTYFNVRIIISVKCSDLFVCYSWVQCYLLISVRPSCRSYHGFMLKYSADFWKKKLLIYTKIDATNNWKLHQSLFYFHQSFQFFIIILLHYIKVRTKTLQCTVSVYFTQSLLSSPQETLIYSRINIYSSLTLLILPVLFPWK